MQCPYCGAELIYVDEYFSGRNENYYGTASNGIYYPSTKQHLGDIYQCPNAEGFEDLEEAQEYKDNNIENCKDLELDEVICDSGCSNGYFYTNKDELLEGYSC